MAARSAGNGWDRVEVNLRLHKARRDKLLALAQGSPGVDSPTQAVDLAIDLAIAGQAIPADRLRAVEAGIEALRTDMGFDAARLEGAVASVAASLEALRRLISDAVAEGEG